MKEKRITLRVTEDTYRRWKDAAKADDRTLVAWVCRRADGKEAVAPSEEAPLTDVNAKEAPLTVEEAPVTNTTSPAPVKINSLLAKIKALDAKS